MMAEFEYVEEIDSTNNELKRRYEVDPPGEYTVLSAGTQTAGRGRSGHQWSSPEGTSIATSMIFYPKDVPTEALSRLTLLSALAVSRAVEEVTGLPTEIKWPNDVLVHGKKICGILTELKAAAGKAEYVVVGIGVNVYMESFPEELSEIATSLFLEGGAHLSRRAITESIWKHFLELYEVFLQSADLSGLRAEYNAKLVNRDRQVRVLDPAGEYEATARGIDETGRLVVITTFSEERHIDSGEVSVRGIYGYT